MGQDLGDVGYVSGWCGRSEGRVGLQLGEGICGDVSITDR